MSKRKSGGARAVEKKHRERAAERKRAASGDWRSEWIAEVDALGAPPEIPERAHLWVARAALLVAKATLRDTAIPPEQMRRDAMKQLEQVSKILDPAKLSAEIDELERALEELRGHAGNIETGEAGSPSPGASLS